VILIDSNVIMYAAGAAHRNRSRSLRYLEFIAKGDIEAALDAEVLQEILHRYKAIGRWVDGMRAYTLARSVVPTVLPIDAETTDRARALMDVYRQLSARDAVHAAVVVVNNLDGICTFDRIYDRIAEVNRIEPE
jgi:predicted nucleic acid-binding protein